MDIRDVAQDFKNSFMHRVMDAYNNRDTDYSYLDNYKPKKKNYRQGSTADRLISNTIGSPSGDAQGETWSFDYTPVDMK